MKKRILLLCAGGTIACRPTENGLVPSLTGEDLLSHMSSMTSSYEITSKDLFSLDSSNIQPEHWQQAARRIYEELNTGHWDGLVVTHGTDTMAYTAAMLSYMLENPPVPIVITGSQLPLEHALTDGYENLRCAMAMAASGTPGVFVAFSHSIILGTRAVKTHSSQLHAFESIHAPAVGTVTAAGLHLNSEALALLPRRPVGAPFRLRDDLCNQVILIKLTPGISPRVFSLLADAGFCGIIIEAFGSGGMAFLRRNLVDTIGDLTRRGVTVAAVSQCLYDGSDLSVYESGRLALSNGILQARDMTAEAAVTKMMWALAQPGDPRDLFLRNVAGEISPV